MAYALFTSKDETFKRAQDRTYQITTLDINDLQVTKNIHIRATTKEPSLANVQFNIHKFNNRPKPTDRKRILIISCFSEFGCETVGCMYCIPRLLQKNAGAYVIAMGWYGREFLYRKLVDEFWEIKEEYMWLRDYTRAFHHVSLNLGRIERSACKYGTVCVSSALGRFLVGNFCKTCGKFWENWQRYQESCPACQSTVLVRSLLTDITEARKTAIFPPVISQQARDWAKTIVKDKTVGVFARGRKTYDRNLSPEFYVNLIKSLESKGFNVIWLGEKQSTQPCPLPHVMDFSRMAESRDLEKTLAIISQLSFTVQFWTASTRLSGMLGVPYLLFESPEQIYSSPRRPGQEGRRLELTTFGPKKICISHYGKSCVNPEKTLNLVNQCVDEMMCGNYSDVMGLVGDPEGVNEMREEYCKGRR